MINNFKKILFDFVLSLIILFTIVISNIYIIDYFNNNNFFVNQISIINSKDNILDKIAILSKKDIWIISKKYTEAVIDSFIEFDQLPSVSDIKYFFELIIKNSENNFKIRDIKIYNNKMIVTFEFKKTENLKIFLKNIKKQDNSNYIFFKKYNITNDRYIIKIYYIRLD